jgi:hypothetical protein
MSHKPVCCQNRLKVECHTGEWHLINIAWTRCCTFGGLCIQHSVQTDETFLSFITTLLLGALLVWHGMCFLVLMNSRFWNLRRHMMPYFVEWVVKTCHGTFIAGNEKKWNVHGVAASSVTQLKFWARGMWKGCGLKTSRHFSFPFVTALNLVWISSGFSFLLSQSGCE